MRQNSYRPTQSHSILKKETFFTEVDIPQSPIKPKVSLPQILSSTKGRRTTKPNLPQKSSSTLNTPRNQLIYKPARQLSSGPFQSTRPSPIPDSQTAKKQLADLFTKNPQTLSSVLRSTIQSSIKQLQNHLMNKAKIYNKEHFQVLQKENLLKRLYTEIAKYHIEDPTQQELKKHLTFRKTELKEINNGIQNQLYYQEILKYMLQQRRSQVDFVLVPLQNLKSDFEKLQQKLNQFQQKRLNYKTDIERIQNSIRFQKKTNDKESKTRKNQIQNMRVTFGAKQHVFSLLINQKLKSAGSQSLFKRIQLMKQMQENYDWLKQQQDSLQQYSHKHHQLLSKQNQFQQIQQVTGVTSISQMLSYNQYLVKSNQHLQQIIAQANEKLEILTVEKEKRKKQLDQFIFYHEQDRHLNRKEFDQIKSFLNQRTLAIDSNERVLSKLLALLTAACTSVNRLSSQLLVKNESIDCKPRNVVKFLDACRVKLEQKLQKVLSENIHWEEESVNTSIRHFYPPKWLNLLITQPQETFQREVHFNQNSGKAVLEYTSNQLQHLRRTKDLDQNHN